MVKKKKPATPRYPSIAFRVTQREKDELSGEIEAVRNLLNKKSIEKEDGSTYWLLNDVIVTALRRGLKTLKK